MAEGNKTERQVKWINIVCLSLITILAIILATRFVTCGGCSVCFTESIANKILLYTLCGLCFGYVASIPIMIYKVRQSRKITGRASDVNDSDCDEGSCSY